MAKSGLKHIDVGNELTKTEWESEESHELVRNTGRAPAILPRRRAQVVHL